MERTVYLYRHHQLDPDGTFGTLLTDGFSCLTIELPWRDNASGDWLTASCIPGERSYSVVRDYSHYFKRRTYRISNVPDRSGVRIHIANMAPELRGCIAPGREIARFPNGLWGVTHSKSALEEFQEHMERRRFTLWVLYSLPDEFRENPIVDKLDKHAKELGVSPFLTGVGM